MSDLRAADLSYDQQALNTGHGWPDDPSPYRRGSRSHFLWKTGREARLMGQSCPSAKDYQKDETHGS